MAGRTAFSARRSGSEVAMALLAAVLLSSACQVERTPRPQVVNADSADAADIDATLTAWTQARLERDARRSASFFTPDATLYSPGAAGAVGSDAIRRTLQQELAERAVTGLTMHRDIIDIAGDSTAYEVGTFSETYRAADAAEQTVDGHYMIRWRREPQATWRIHTMMLSRAPVDTAAAAADSTR